jgi:hypothetical protein
VSYFNANVGTNAVASYGWNIEGLGYTYYPFGNFIAPYAIAMQRFDPTNDLRRLSMGAEWSLWSSYATVTPIMGPSTPSHPDFGDDNAGAGGEGTYGQAF